MPDTLSKLLTAHEAEITDRYVKLIKASSPHYMTASSDEIARNCHWSFQLLGTLHREPANQEVRAYIRNLCEQRVPTGYRIGEVMNALFLLGDVVTPLVRREFEGQLELARKAADQLRTGLNQLAVLWAEGYFELQDEIMARKERAMRQLSTPVTCVWDGILTLPLIGDVDDWRSRQVTEDLLNQIISTQSSFVLLDITGIGAINTSVIAQMIRTVRAAELLGAECWIVGISPEVAHTIVNLGVDLRSITTHANLREGLASALARLGLKVVPTASAVVCPASTGE